MVGLIGSCMYVYMYLDLRHKIRLVNKPKPLRLSFMRLIGGVYVRRWAVIAMGTCGGGTTAQPRWIHDCLLALGLWMDGTVRNLLEVTRYVSGWVDCR